MVNTQKIVTGAFAGVGIVGWIFVRQIVDMLWGIFKLPIPQSLPFLPADAIGAVTAVLVFLILIKNAKVVRFSNDVVVELSKVTWPPRKETLLSTVVVTIMVGICAFILFGFDTLWGTLVKMLYK